MDTEEPTLFPFRPGDWVADVNERVGRVKTVGWCHFGHEVILDIILYSHNGDKTGRESPACGGPRTFEPACSARYWHRIAEPHFPIAIRWVEDEKGLKYARHYAGETLPPANWKKPVRKAKFRIPETNDRFTREELARIAEHFSGANDDLAKMIFEKASRS